MSYVIHMPEVASSHASLLVMKVGPRMQTVNSSILDIYVSMGYGIIGMSF
jgi:hypothetical protein